eukprot:1136520-Pelagomonas_calceolata.AAC.3
MVCVLFIKDTLPEKVRDVTHGVAEVCVNKFTNASVAESLVNGFDVIEKQAFILFYEVELDRGSPWQDLLGAVICKGGAAEDVGKVCFRGISVSKRNCVYGRALLRKASTEGAPCSVGRGKGRVRHLE